MRSYRQFILEQLATATQAGLPLHRAARNAAAEAPSLRLREDLGVIAAQLEGGVKLDFALARFPWLFSEGDVNAVAMAESQGRLREVLQLMARHARRQRRRERVLRESLALPLLEFVVLIMFLALLMIFIFPKYTEMFKELTEGHQNLPPAMVSIILGWRSGGGICIFLGCIALVWLIGQGILALSGLVMPYYTMRLEHWVADLLEELFPVLENVGRGSGVWFWLPGLRAWGREALTMRFCSYMELFLAARLTAVDALEAAAGSVRRMAFSRRLAWVKEMANQGMKLSDALEVSRVFPSTALWLIRNGEARGEVAEAFGAVADFYATKLDSRARRMRDWPQPVGALVIGTVVGLLAYAIFGTFVRIMQNLQ